MSIRPSSFVHLPVERNRTLKGQSGFHPLHIAVSKAEQVITNDFNRSQTALTEFARQITLIDTF
jgi:hypothetical protein